jgi:hypothetical protein
MPVETPAVAGVPRFILRAEGAAIALLAATIYAKLNAPWWLFAVLFLAPDLSFLGYLAGSRIGAVVYNAAHTLLAPTALALAGIVLPHIDALWIAAIWAAHIGFDRALGYGLKYATGFGFTHLGRVGREAAAARES